MLKKLCFFIIFPIHRLQRVFVPYTTAAVDRLALVLNSIPNDCEDIATRNELYVTTASLILVC